MLATTLVRKGKGEAAFWFGLGALITGLFIKRRLAIAERFGSHSGTPNTWFRRRGRKAVSWKLTVIGEEGSTDSEKDKEEEAVAMAECRECAKALSRVCECGYTDRPAADVVFDAGDAEEKTPDVTEEKKINAPLVSLSLFEEDVIRR